MRRVAALAAALLLLAGGIGAEPPKDAPVPTLVRVVIEGAINPAVADFIHDAIVEAEAEQAPALVIQLDTPGGLLPSMRAIVKDILGARVPVIVYVAPSGAGAGSAGVFITMAAHVAAMAPSTNIGAAHPVGGSGEDIKGTLGKKIENDIASFSQSIAQRRGRNIEWAVKAVRESVSITSDEAAKTHVVDFVARDLADLVKQADGREVDVAGTKRKLALAATIGSDGAVRVRTSEMRLAQRVLNALADPNVAYLLMMAGLLGLYVEFTHPGLSFPGIAGAICLMLAMAALHVLPVNTIGLGLLLLGAALLVAEAFLPTFGLAGVGGVVAFLLGSLFLFDTAGTGVAVARGLVFGVGGSLAAVILVVGALVVRTRRSQPRTGGEGMVGEIGVLRERGLVAVHGEYWKAESDEPVDVGERVEVTAVHGLTLTVRRAR